MAGISTSFGTIDVDTIILGSTPLTITGSELNYLDIAVLGTGAASKAVVLDSGDDYTWPATGVLTYGVLNDGTTTLGATALEINAACDVSARLVDLDATTLAVTPALHSGRIITLSHTAATSTVTLPAATGTGDIYTFIVAAVNVNNHVIQVADATDEFAGTIFQTDTDTTDTLISIPCLAGDNFDTITLNGTTSGGFVGDIITLTDLATDVWQIQGHTNASGVVASPFSSGV